MSRRSPKQATVSLFPFLAVLICAMGALIFLLVVTTRMIRDESQKQHELTTEAETSLPPVEIALGTAAELPAIPRRMPDETPLIAPRVIIIRRDTPPPPPDLSAQITGRQQELEALRAARLSGERDAERNRAELAALQKTVSERRAVLERAATVTGELRTKVKEQAGTLEANRVRSRALSVDIQSVRRELIERSERKESANSLRIEAFDGRRGTIRRPIVIECLADRYIFHPEGIELTEDQLVGFSARENPLLAGVQALSHYWGHRDGVRSDNEGAYVLLVVRPEGIPAFYVARKFLSEYKQPFGYELIPRNKELAFDDADEGARNICRKAIDRLIESHDVAAASPDASPFREVMRDAPRPRGNSSQPVETTPSASGESGQYRFVRTPRGLELVRDDGAGVPAPRQKVETKPIPVQPALIEPAVPAASNRPQVLAGETPPNRPAQAVETVIPIDTPTDVPAAGTIPLRDVASPTQSGSERNHSPFANSDDIPWLKLPEQLETEAGAKSTGTATANAPAASLDAFEAPQRNTEASHREGQPGIGPGNASPRGKDQVSPGQLPERGMAFVRHLIIQVHADRIQVADRSPVAVTPGGSSDDLLAQVLQEARAHMGDWGAAPRNFYWKPKVAFVIYPGGLHPFERVRPYFEQRELIAGVDFEIDPPAPSAREESR